MINTTKTNLPKLAVSLADAAEMLSVSRTTLYDFVRRGLIHPVKACRKPIFAVTELQRFLDDASLTIRL